MPVNRRTMDYAIRQKQSLCLQGKVQMSLNRIEQWYEHWDGRVYISFSGGKDSWVLANLVWRLYPDIPAVFSLTGMEYPEITSFVKQVQKDRPVIIVRPSASYRQVLLDHGYPAVSKQVAKQVRVLRTCADNPRCKNMYRLYLSGIRRDGKFCPRSSLPAKWKYLVDGPYPISEKCCDLLKKRPLDLYSRSTGRNRMTGMMAEEGGRRAFRRKCSVFGADPNSAPMLFWTTQDVWSYIEAEKIGCSSIYSMGEERTGCTFCLFGAHLEREPNRFQRMKRHHPRMWSYCIQSLGLGKVLEFLRVPYS